MNIGAIRGSGCTTDHNILKYVIVFTIKNRNLKIGAKPPIKLRDKEAQQMFEERMDKILDKLAHSEMRIEHNWNSLFQATSKETPRLVC